MPKRNILWVLVVLAGFVVAYQAKGFAPFVDRDNYDQFENLANILQQVSERYVHEVDKKALLEGAARGMLAELDPYSTYIPPRLRSEFDKDVQGQFGGIGIKIGTKNNQLVVISPLEGTPAFRAGILAGDLIVKIDGESADGITLSDAVERLTGEPGTRVTISVLHEGDNNPVDVTIMRAHIVIPSVVGHGRAANGDWDYFVDPKAKIGYVRLVSFQRDTATSLDKAVAEMKAKGVRGLVFDLRFNPGGLLSSAIEISDRFLESEVIVSTRGRDGRQLEEEVAKPENTYDNFPVVVLVNRYSASAAEIVSGALQDNHRAVVIGERTFGKGSVQSIIELGEGRGALKLTTAEYYLPSGRSISRPETLGRGVKGAADRAKKDKRDTADEAAWGVEPDIEVAFTDQENRQLLLQRREADVIKAGGPTTHPTTKPAATGAVPAPAAPGEPAEAQAPFVDRQLERAVDVLKAYEVWKPRPASAPRRTDGRRAAAETTVP